MDDLLGLNEIELNNNSNNYFEEEDKKEELYIKMIEDRIIFKIRKEIIEPLISDFNFKIDINTREISKLNQDKLELKEYLDKEKIKNIELTEEINRLNNNYHVIKNEKNEVKEYLKNIQNDIVPIGVCLTNIQNDMVRMEDNINELYLLREQLTRNVTQTDKLSNIISKLKVYTRTRPPIMYSQNYDAVSHYDFKEITAEELLIDGVPNKFVSCWTVDIQNFYCLKKLHLKQITAVDLQMMHNEYVDTLILECGGCKPGIGGLQWSDNNGLPNRSGIVIVNLNCLPSLKVIIFKEINEIDVDEFIKELSSYEHKIETIVFIDCIFIKHRFSYMVPFEQLKSYCDENNIKFEF
jgi:hypothetical protein